jgi:hypothetical protein
MSGLAQHHTLMVIAAQQTTNDLLLGESKVLIPRSCDQMLLQIAADVCVVAPGGHVWIRLFKSYFNRI